MKNQNNLINVFKVLIFTGIFALLLTPFFVANSMFFPYITGKAYYFRIIVEIIFLLWIGLAMLDKTYRPKKNFILFSFTAFIISIFFSNLFGVNQVASFWSNFERMEGFVSLIHFYALFIVAGSVLKNKKDWKILFDVSIGFAIFSMLISLPDYFKKLAIEGEYFRNPGTLGNPIYLAIYTMFHIFFALININSTKETWQKVVYGVSIIFFAYILNTTITRGTVLGLVGGFGIILLGVSIFRFKAKDLLWKISTSIIVISIIAVSVFVLNKDSAFVKNNPLLSRFAEISLDSGTSQARILNWQIATEGFKERPILGWGQSNYNYVFDKNYLPAMHGNEYMFDRVHNIVFDWLIAGGMFGLILFFSIFIFAIYYIFRNKNLDSNTKLILTAIIAGYFIHNIFVFDQIVSYLFIFLVLAYIYSQSDDKIICESKIKDELSKIVIYSLIILIPFVVYLVNYNSIKANTNLLKGVQLVKVDQNKNYLPFHPNGLADNIKYFQNAIAYDPKIKGEWLLRLLELNNSASRISGAYEKEKAELNEWVIREMNNYIDSGLADTRFHLMMSQKFANEGKFDLALEYVNKGIERSPNRQILLMTKAKILLSQKKLNEGYETIKYAYELDKSKDDVWQLYAATLSAYDKKLFQEFIKEESENNFERVEEYLKSVIDKKPEELQPRISLAAFYFEADKKEMAIASLEETAVQLPKYKYQINTIIQVIKSGKDPRLAQ